MAEGLRDKSPTSATLLPSPGMSARPRGKSPGKELETLRVVLRIWDWSEWCRQVVRGAQKFAHDRPRWRLYVDVGQTRSIQVNTAELDVDGIITHLLHDVQGYQRLLQRGRAKVVSFAASVPAALSELPRVRVDDGKVAEVIARHLTTGGFRRLAYCGGGIDPAEIADGRHLAIQACAASLGYEYSVYQQRARRAPGLDMAALTRWVAQLSKPVGVVAWNLDVARRVIQAATRAEVAVPNQLAVVAWDDDPMLAETMEPTVSAAVLPAERMGYEAARLLDAIMSGGAFTSPVVLEPSGVVRIRQSSDVSALADREVFLAMQYIHEHAAEPLKIPQIAEIVRVSRRKLELDFTRVVGHTPYEALLRVRVELAKRYLVDTDWPLATVAERSGLGEKTTLHRLFVHREQITPGEFRTRYGLARSHP